VIGRSAHPITCTPLQNGDVLVASNKVEKQKTEKKKRSQTKMNKTKKNVEYRDQTKRVSKRERCGKTQKQRQRPNLEGASPT
jgi:hypothetical protein